MVVRILIRFIFLFSNDSDYLNVHASTQSVLVASTNSIATWSRQVLYWIECIAHPEEKISFIQMQREGAQMNAVYILVWVCHRIVASRLYRIGYSNVIGNITWFYALSRLDGTLLFVNIDKCMELKYTENAYYFRKISCSGWLKGVQLWWMPMKTIDAPENEEERNGERADTQQS